MYTYNAKLVRVVDGDTVDLKIDLGFDIWINERVRLKDIDAPEVRTRDLQEKEDAATTQQQPRCCQSESGRPKCRLKTRSRSAET